MTDALVIAALVIAIAVVAWLKARAAIRRDRDTGRGLAPGTGDHIIEVEYSSGLGGGQAMQIRVPRDPQAYARSFVPRRAARRRGPDDIAASGTGARRPQGAPEGEDER